ncbi:MAG TPA: hypothetical protein VMR86_08725 [Myxococcota bacterium]|nr:hypothetical protein [Myxococcota bacterium]
MTAGKWLVVAALALGLVPKLAAADYWRYETDSGSTAFTDDAKNIPAKYRASAVKIAEEPLATYRKLSVVQTSPTATPNGVAAQRADALPPRAEAPLAQAGPGVQRLGINVSGVQVDIDADADEPIHIDKRQWEDDNGDYFDHGGTMAPTTVIRKGDRPLAYIDER